MTGLKVGSKAPKFETIDAQGNKVSSELLVGRRWVIYFYPKDLTPGCINQACSIRDHYGEFLKKGIPIYGVSMDTERIHLRFSDKYELPFPLLMDEKRKLINAFKVWGPKKFMGREYDGIHRTTFIVNEKGKIEHIIERPKTKIHAEELLALLG